MPLPPPPLPRFLADPTPAVLAGTAIWLLATIVLAFTDPGSTAFLTALCGFLLGLIGYGIFRWQRSAARRGSRTAQQGL
ncbi:MAG TPA: DUF2530 domain-containing protein [Pseudonocardiaceae bacterium]